MSTTSIFLPCARWCPYLIRVPPASRPFFRAGSTVPMAPRAQRPRQQHPDARKLAACSRRAWSALAALGEAGCRPSQQDLTEKLVYARLKRDDRDSRGEHIRSEHMVSPIDHAAMNHQINHT
jgi:hypothetical protein